MNLFPVGYVGTGKPDAVERAGIDEMKSTSPTIEPCGPEDIYREKFCMRQ